MDGQTLAKQVLSQLLDKYEDSQAFQRDDVTARRPQVRVTDAVAPGYQSGTLDPDVRRELHAVLTDYMAHGLLELRWVRFEEGNILDRALLEWDGIPMAYELLDRTPRREELAWLKNEIAKWLDGLTLTEGYAWIGTWAQDVMHAVEVRGRVPAALIPREPEPRGHLLRALAGVVKQHGEPVPMRLFSKRWLGNSKLFETEVRGRFVGVVRRYALPTWTLLDPVAFTDDADLLRELGIEVTQEDVAMCGPIRFGWSTPQVGEGDAPDDERGQPSGRVVDGRVFPHGFAIDAADVDTLEVLDLPVWRILTIENKANYRYYVRWEKRDDELVIYLGGFASPGQRRLLRKLRNVLEQPCQNGEPRLDHWGDLDYGGVLILQHLRDTCWPEAQPWRMEPKLLDQHAQLREPFDGDYQSKLERLLTDTRYEWARPLLRRMLEVGGILEQESLLV